MNLQARAAKFWRNLPLLPLYVLQPKEDSNFINCEPISCSYGLRQRSLGLQMMEYSNITPGPATEQPAHYAGLLCHCW